MSWQATAWVKATRGHRTIADKAVLFLLSESADAETWECWPSQDTMADDLECSKRTIQRSLDSLEEGGFITTLQIGNQYAHSIYRLNGAEEVDKSSRSEHDKLSHAPSANTNEQTPRVPSEGDTGDARTVKNRQEISETSFPRLPEDEDDFLNKYSTFYTTLLGSSLFASAVVAPGPYFRTLQKQGDQPPPVDFEVVLDTMRWIYSAFNAHPQRLAQKLTVPAPSYLAGLAAVWPVLDKERIGPQTLNLVLHRVCEERGVSLSADKILAQVGTHPDSFIEAIEQLVASVQ